MPNDPPTNTPTSSTSATSALVLNAHALTAWREERGFRKTDLAAAAEISLGHLCDLETGRRTGSAPVIRRLADALKVNVRVLVRNPNDAEVAA